MQDLKLKNKENKTIEIKALPPDEKDRLLNFFILLRKVDKRVNPALYQNKKQIDQEK